MASAHGRPGQLGDGGSMRMGQVRGSSSSSAQRHSKARTLTAARENSAKIPREPQVAHGPARCRRASSCPLEKPDPGQGRVEPRPELAWNRSGIDDPVVSATGATPPLGTGRSELPCSVRPCLPVQGRAKGPEPFRPARGVLGESAERVRASGKRGRDLRGRPKLSYGRGAGANLGYGLSPRVSPRLSPRLSGSALLPARQPPRCFQGSRYVPCFPGVWFHWQGSADRPRGGAGDRRDPRPFDESGHRGDRMRPRPIGRHDPDLWSGVVVEVRVGEPRAVRRP